jgi:WD40 repeat protein
VTSIALCPSKDDFISCSKDNTVRLWNLQSPWRLPCNLRPLRDRHRHRVTAYTECAPLRYAQLR